MPFHMKIGKGGCVIIPAIYRKALKLRIGDELIISLEDGELRLFKQCDALQKIQKSATRKSRIKNHIDDFITFRKKDSE